MKNLALICLAALFAVTMTSKAGADDTKPAKKAKKTEATKETAKEPVKEVRKEETKKKFVRDYGMAGCGLGAVIVGKHGGQIFASTTNSTVWNQLFAITSGTLNCIDEASAEVASRSDYYIKANRYALESDVARGSGETLAGLSKVLGCSSETASGLSQALQMNYQQIFVQGSVPNEVTDSIITVIINSGDLAGQCHLS